MQTNDYVPRPEVLEHLSTVDFVAFVGPTASGKTTLMHALERRYSHIKTVVVSTSRAPRPGEIDGVDYHFYSEQTMQKRIADRDFVQVAPSVLAAYYATDSEAYISEGLAIMAVITAALTVFQHLPFKRFRMIYILPPSWEEWQRRIAAHSFSADEYGRRLIEAEQSLVYALQERDILFVINDDKDLAVYQIEDYLLRDVALPEQKAARLLAQQLLEKTKLQHLPL